MRLYTCLIPPNRGRCHETSFQRGGMRRPRAGDETYPPHPGGAGAPPAGTMTRREELADGRAAWPARGAKARLPKRGCVGASKAGRRGRRKRGPAPDKRRRGAPRGARVARKGRAARNKRQRLAALHPLGFFAGGRLPRAPCRGARETRRRTRRRSRIRALALGCPTNCIGAAIPLPLWEKACPAKAGGGECGAIASTSRVRGGGFS